MREKTRKYGRGKFPAHIEYIKYMEKIVKDDSYTGMPNAISPDGHINWQVSSGKTTSFYQFYKSRFEWWVKKADELKLKGIGNSDDRFSIAARLIHPKKIRPCRLCGLYSNVGYFYLNKSLAKRWNLLARGEFFHSSENIKEALLKLSKFISAEKLTNEVNFLFPNRDFKSSNLKEIISVFESSTHLRSQWLSPGFMCNPPDRLDGFHDYGLCCRKTKDPGRSDMNLKSYLHDRRAFNWWSEGDWKTADALFNSAGMGTCLICGRENVKISPDHIGPLSCGFKHMPIFNTLCSRCNSSKNRRFTKKDIDILLVIEKQSDESVASWQIRTAWDLLKGNVKDDYDAKEISNILRGIEDYYLRFLFMLKSSKLSFFMTRYLSPELAHNEIIFKNLDPSTLTFQSVTINKKKTLGSVSLEARVIRIAIDELDSYVLKLLQNRKIRKIRKDFDPEGWEHIQLMIKNILPTITSYELEWDSVIKSNLTKEEKDLKIRKLLTNPAFLNKSQLYEELDTAIKKHFSKVGLIAYQHFFSGKEREIPQN